MDDFVKSLNEIEGSKIDAFERSTLKLVLRQLGATRQWIDDRFRDLAQQGTFEFNFQWFNDEDFIPIYVVSDRCFTFNFTEMFWKPSKSPLVELFSKAEEEHRERRGEKPFCMIFKCYERGRLLALCPEAHKSFLDSEQTYLHVSTSRTEFTVIPFAGFFQERFHMSQE